MKFSEALSALEVRWFMSSMATGAVGILWTKMSVFLVQPWMNTLGVVLLFLAFFLFLIASVGYGFRVIFFWENVEKDFLSPSTAKFFSGISISLAVLSTGVSLVFVPQGILGHTFGMYLAGIFYVIGFVLGIFFLLATCSQTIISHETEMKHAIGVCLLPPVGVFVNIFSGNFFATTFLKGTVFLNIIGLIHFFLLGLLFLLTAFVLTFILFRLKFAPLPQKEMAPSFFIPLAPVGVLTIASVSLLPLLSEILPYKALLTNALYLLLPVFLSFGFFWFLIILRVMTNYIKTEGIPYTLGFWALVFPPAALGTGTFVAGGFLPGMGFLSWIGVLLGALSLALWGFVFTRTLLGIFSGRAFSRPVCLKK
ncbi:hypothetical protein IPN35_02950 [Candidatus Peregrinibacteria bacterium]|nr:MAG: hypothetical protein IPN35_02950 [Candidatus Peregrinibacteria bacterium]